MDDVITKNAGPPPAKRTRPHTVHGMRPEELLIIRASRRGRVTLTRGLDIIPPAEAGLLCQSCDQKTKLPDEPPASQ